MCISLQYSLTENCFARNQYPYRKAMKFAFFILILAGMQHNIIISAQLPRQQITIGPSIINGNGTFQGCPSQQQREGLRQGIKVAVTNALGHDPMVRCGTGQWIQVAYLNMSDSMQSCPSPWQIRSASGVRACGRPSSGCHGTVYSSGGRTYSRVCGRVIGYQFGHTDGFSSSSIDTVYVEGVSITHGSPRSHIWTFVADRYESDVADCPCKGGPNTPAFVGSDYYCESGNNGTSTAEIFYANDPLWDGQQCESEGTCCSTAPWFVVDIMNPTTDSIEVRICASLSPSSEDTRINMLELYIQ